MGSSISLRMLRMRCSEMAFGALRLATLATGRFDRALGHDRRVGSGSGRLVLRWNGVWNGGRYPEDTRNCEEVGAHC